MSNAGRATEENAGNATETHGSLCIPITDAQMCDMKKEIRGNLYATAGPAPLSSHNVMTLEKW